MITSKKLRYFVLSALMVTTPVHSNSLLNSCIQGFASGVTEQIGNIIINASPSTQKKIAVGLAALIVTYALIRYIVRKRHEAYEIALAEKERLSQERFSADKRLICSLKESDLENPFNAKGEPVLKEKIRGSLLAFAARHNPQILSSLIRYGQLTGNVRESYIENALFELAKNSTTLNERNGIVTLIKNGADVNARMPRMYRLHDPQFKRSGTPLTDAIVVGKPSTIKVLLENGAALEVCPAVNVYDYVEDIDENISGRRNAKQQARAVLDNHRRRIASRYKSEAEKEVVNYIFKGPASIVKEYVEPIYPLMDQYPLTSFEVVDDYDNEDDN